MSVTSYPSALDNPIFRVLSQAAANLGVESYVIGGFVRDYLLQRGELKDIDIVCR
ncbi:MAG: tRNA nucleotidyltransferase, partial [Bacteroidetes bacterium]|nr:tRNA nucleotidyltransferase [Bacteroidota bacterium]